MHQRAWLSLLTLPLVTAFTYPMVVQQVTPPAKVETLQVKQDPLAGLADVNDVLNKVQDDYVDEVDLTKVIHGGIDNALERAHPLNAYLSPEDLKLPDPGPAQVGISILKKNIWIQVLAVVPGSPAAKAGLRPGDVIRKINGESIGPFSAWALERKLKGAPGSSLDLMNQDSSTGSLKKITLTREIIARPAIGVRQDPKAILLEIPDLGKGRAEEIKNLLSGVDPALPLVLDLRNCGGGDLAEAAQLAGLMVGEGTLVTVQETGKPERTIPVKGTSGVSRQVAVLQGVGTVGAAEALSAYLKKQAVPVIGERSVGLGVERNRLLLKQGGAVELVTRRWLGAGQEKLDRQGVAPTDVLRLPQPTDDPLPKVLEILQAKAMKKAA